MRMRVTMLLVLRQAQWVTAPIAPWKQIPLLGPMLLRLRVKVAEAQAMFLALPLACLRQ